MSNLSRSSARPTRPWKVPVQTVRSRSWASSALAYGARVPPTSRPPPPFGSPQSARRGRRSDDAGALPAEVGLHEPVEVAVEDGAYVAHLVVGAQVLHQLVGLHHVGADLAAPA